MSTPDPLPNTVRARRLALGWSQQRLADRAGLSRAGVSAIEAGRLAPSVTAGLALARALECTVEQLFAPVRSDERGAEWAISPATDAARYWQARLGGRLLMYPVGDDALSSHWHDGVCRSGVEPAGADLAERTLVVAGCDPAAGLLAAEYGRQFPFRMIVLRRSSRAALDLLAAGLVHAAGVHLGRSGRASKNLHEARSRLGAACSLVRVARWEEGLALSPRLRVGNIASLRQSKVRWVGREEGSGARQCQDEVLAGARAPRHVAFDHRSVAAAIKCGWADVGPCVRLASEESGLGFLKVSTNDYDICFASQSEADPRIAALLTTLRSRAYRSRLAELPGYSTSSTGELSG
jgi:molybdate-binding protein/transcriptional regulator with XRE-family HTH domain